MQGYPCLQLRVIVLLLLSLETTDLQCQLINETVFLDQQTLQINLVFPQLMHLLRLLVTVNSYTLQVIACLLKRHFQLLKLIRLLIQLA